MVPNFPDARLNHAENVLWMHRRRIAIVETCHVACLPELVPKFAATIRPGGSEIQFLHFIPLLNPPGVSRNIIS